MWDGRRVFQLIITILITIVMLVGAFWLSLVEGNMLLPTLTQPPATTQAPTLTQPVKATHPVVVTLTWQPSASLTETTTTFIPTSTPTPPFTPTNCQPPAGWVAYIVEPGDTLEELAIRFQKTIFEISSANCLLTAILLPGQVVYLPPLPSHTPLSTQPHIPCGAPASWIIYYVQPGDTLYHLGQAYGIPWTDIQIANCLNSINLIVGQRLYVPPWATHTPTPTYPSYPTMTDTPFETPTETVTQPYSETSTDIPTPSPTDTLPSP